ncbi:flagella basal body P-ring formation protein FlgA, partial [Acinetobacter baumannii]
SKIEISYEDIDLIKLKVTQDKLALGPFDEKIWLVEAAKINTPILKSHLKTAPLVVRNQTVKVIAVANNIMVETEGVAQQFGQYLE